MLVPECSRSIKPPTAFCSEGRSTAEALGDVERDHYVFPACENGRIEPASPMKGLAFGLEVDDKEGRSTRLPLP